MTVGFGTYHILKSDKYLDFAVKIADQHLLKTWPMVKNLSEAKWAEEVRFVDEGDTVEIKDEAYLVLSGLLENSKDQRKAAEGAFLWSRSELGLKGNWVAKNKAVVYRFNEDKLRKILQDNGYWDELLEFKK